MANPVLVCSHCGREVHLTVKLDRFCGGCARAETDCACDPSLAFRQTRALEAIAVNTNRIYVESKRQR